MEIFHKWLDYVINVETDYRSVQRELRDKSLRNHRRENEDPKHSGSDHSRF